MDDTTQLFSSINHLKNKRDLTQQEIASCVQELVKESTSLELKKRFLLLLSQKGESDDEFAHFVNVIHHHLLPEIFIFVMGFGNVGYMV